MAFFSWLAGTRAGRWTAVIMAALAAFFIAAAKIFSAGQTAEKSKQDRAALDAVKQKVKSDESVDRLSPDARRKRLRQWGRNG